MDLGGPAGVGNVRMRVLAHRVGRRRPVTNEHHKEISSAHFDWQSMTAWVR
jgi:hypothetical protein